METLYLNLKQYLFNNNISVPETVLEIEYLPSPKRTQRSTVREKSPSEIQKVLKLKETSLENSKEIIQKLMENNKQLNELAKRVIDENKVLKEENLKYNEKINSISPIINKNSFTPTTSQSQFLRSSIATQVSEFQNNVNYSPNSRILRTPPSSKSKIIFEPIKNSLSKSPLRKSTIFENSVQAFDIESSQTLNRNKHRDSEFNGRYEQPARQSHEILQLNNIIQKQKIQIKDLEDRLDKQQQMYDKQIISLKNSSKNEMANLLQETQINQKKMNLLQQENFELTKKTKISEEMSILLKQTIEKQKQELQNGQIHRDQQSNFKANILNEDNLNSSTGYYNKEQHKQIQQPYDQNQQSLEYLEDNHFQIINLKQQNQDKNQNQSDSKNKNQDQSSKNKKMRINSHLDHRSKMSIQIQGNNEIHQNSQRQIKQTLQPQFSSDDQYYNDSREQISNEGSQSTFQIEQVAQQSQISSTQKYSK